MHCAFKSFEGKSTQVQAMIVQDINNDELINPSMNFDQVANTYSSFISTLQAGKGSSINYVVDHNAKSSTKRSGYDRNQRERRRYGRNTERQKDTRTQKSDFKSGVFCQHCKREGHREDDCRF